MPARILIAKPGLDGHDRGAKIIARTLRDAGFEVILTGIRQKVDAIVATAIQEDVAVVGLSILSGAHLALTARTIEGLRNAGAGDIAVVVGGTIPAADVAKLREAGAAGVFPTGTPLESVVAQVRALTTPAPAVIPRGDDPPYPPMSVRPGPNAKTAILSGPAARTEVSGDDPVTPRHA
jgi:methylmalonyl-CoA mutase, C-terminal domain